ncbi:hypothetical protein AB0D11_02915 [Streptomyces monashensis]
MRFRGNADAENALDRLTDSPDDESAQVCNDKIDVQGNWTTP